MLTTKEKYDALQRTLAYLVINKEKSPEIITKTIAETVDSSDFTTEEQTFYKTLFQTLPQLFSPVSEQSKHDESIFLNMFSNISDAAYILDFNWNYLDANAAAEISFGYRKEYLKQNNATQLILNRCIDKLQRFISPEYKEVQRFYDYAVSQEGKIVPVEIVAQIIAYEKADAILLLIKDITDRRETEREILQAIIGTEERERKRFAKDLHDGLGPLLSSLKLYLSAIERAASEEKRKPIIVQVHEVIDESIRSIKEIANNISPHLLSNFGLVSAVRDICNKINGANSLQIDFTNNCDEFRFDRNMETILFRIIEEMLNNTIKHAQASYVKLALILTGNILYVNYKDNGKGFHLEDKLSSPERGMGISNIFNRIRTINGTHKIITNPGEGFSCQIEVAIK